MQAGHGGWRRAVEACLDGELAVAQQEAACRHLEGCSDCDAHASLLLAVRGSLRRVVHRLPALRPGRLEGLAAQLHQSEQAGRQPDRTGLPAHGS